jgi:hypothetical protein
LQHRQRPGNARHAEAETGADGLTRLAYRCIGGVVGLVDHDLD